MPPWMRCPPASGAHGSHAATDDEVAFGKSRSAATWSAWKCVTTMRCTSRAAYPARCSAKSGSRARPAAPQTPHRRASAAPVAPGQTRAIPRIDQHRSELDAPACRTAPWNCDPAPRTATQHDAPARTMALLMKRGALMDASGTTPVWPNEMPAEVLEQRPLALSEPSLETRHANAVGSEAATCCRSRGRCRRRTRRKPETRLRQVRQRTRAGSVRYFATTSTSPRYSGLLCARSRSRKAGNASP